MPKVADDKFKDLYVAQAVILLSCLVPDLLLLPRDPVVAWLLLCARVTELGVLEHYGVYSTPSCQSTTAKTLV